MINQFRILTPINILLLLVYTFFMRWAIYVNMPEGLNYSFLEFFQRLQIDISLTDSMSPLVNITIATLTVFVQALLFNRIINNHNLLVKQSFLPALMYVTASSLFMPFMLLSPTLMCNFLLIWMIDLFLKLGKAGNTTTMIFDIGMIIGLGTLIYFPFVGMLLLIFVSLMLFRSFNWREWLAGIVGFIIVFFFLAVWYYWENNLSAFYTIWKSFGNKFPSVITINYNDYLVLIPVFIILALATVILIENFYRSFINTRKAFQLLFFMFIIGLLSFYLRAEFRLSHFLLAVPAGSVLLAYYFSLAKIRWFYESLFIVFVLSIQYFLFV